MRLARRCWRRRCGAERTGRHVRGTSVVEPHRPEPAGIVEHHRRAVRHVKHDMVVFGERDGAIRVDVERARHPKVHHEHVARRQIADQVLAATTQRLNNRSFEARREARRQERAQSTASHDDPLEPCVLHRRTQFSHGTLDFRQFRHVLMLANQCGGVSAARWRSSRTF